MHKYITKAGDTFDSISFDVYGSEKYSSKIIESNLNYLNVIIFDSDIELVIPKIDIKIKSTLPPWKR